MGNQKISKILNLLDKEDDLNDIEHAVESYKTIIDHLSGKGHNPSRAPACMNRTIISALEQRIQFLTVKRLAIELSPKANTKTELTSLVQSSLSKRLNKTGICDTDITKWSTIRKWIYADASEIYPPARK